MERTFRSAASQCSTEFNDQNIKFPGQGLRRMFRVLARRAALETGELAQSTGRNHTEMILKPLLQNFSFENSQSVHVEASSATALKDMV